MLRVDPEDILLSFPYSIEVESKSNFLIKWYINWCPNPNSTEGLDATEVKILVVMDVLQDFKSIIEGERFNKDLKFFDFKKYLDCKLLLNYELVIPY